MKRRTPLEVVVIGFGPVAARLIDELLPQVSDGRVHLTIIGAEREPAYNRVLLGEVAVGRSIVGAIDLADPLWAAAGVVILAGARALRVDRARQAVSLDSGSRISYDRLVFATGSRSVIPAIDGLDESALDLFRQDLSRRPEALDRILPGGVTVLRDLRDAATVLSHVVAGNRIVVLGGGVLGLEIALAAAESGAEVCIVHTGTHPMARNLDRGGGTVVARTLEARGIALVGGTAPTGVAFHPDEADDPTFLGLVFDDGRVIGGDLLLISCGVAARSELAKDCGLPVASGILVDTSLQSWIDTRVFAIGDCAQVTDPREEATGFDGMGGRETSGRTSGRTSSGRITDGAPTGQIAPGWRQAAQLAARFAAEVSPDVEVDLPALPPTVSRPASAPVLMLKGDGIDVVSAGVIDVELWDSPSVDHAQGCTPTGVSQWADPEHGRYVKLVTRAGVLTGMVCVGMPRTGAELTLLYESGRELPADRSVLLRYDGPDYVADVAFGDLDSAATVCWCNGVTVGAILGSIESGSTTVECVGKDTRAGTGCGGCTGRIAQVLAQANPPITRSRV